MISTNLPDITQCGVCFKVYDSVRVGHVVTTAAFLPFSYMLQFDDLLQKMTMICQFRFSWSITMHFKMSPIAVAYKLLVDNVTGITVNVIITDLMS